MFSSKYLLVVAAGAVSCVSAQGLSTGCQAGLAGLALNPSNACLNLQGLIGLVNIGNASLVDPLNTWLGGFCSQPACSNDTLSSVVNTLTSDCSAEISSLGVQGVSPAQLTTLVQGLFPVVKEVGCLQDQANNTLCATETLRGYESVNGPLTTNALSQLLGEVTSSAVPPSVPQSVECSNCAKQAYNIITQKFPSVISSDEEQNAQQTCGAGFTDGQTPSGITSTANTDIQASGNSTSTSGAQAMTYNPGAALSIFFTIASLFTIAA